MYKRSFVTILLSVLNIIYKNKIKTESILKKESLVHFHSFLSIYVRVRSLTIEFKFM